MRTLLPVLLVSLTLCCIGCRSNRLLIWNDPMRNRAQRVESGDRFYFFLPEPAAEGCRWYATCDDDDVEVRIVHDRTDQEAEVRVRISRGYDGPTTIQFVLHPPDRPAEIKRQFTLTLFKRSDDVPFWEE